jgi:general secretion pathway protein C
MEQIQTFLRRRFYLVNLFFITVCSSLGGLLVSNILEAYLIRPPKEAKRGRRRRVPRKKKKKKTKLYKSRYTVARRNIFCSSCENKVTEEGKEKAVASLLDAELLVTFVSDDPNWSMAAIRTTEPKRVLMVGIGQTIGDAELIRVEMRRVEFRRNGRLEYLDLFGEGGEKKAPPRKTASRRRRRRRNTKYDKGIKKIGKHRYEIERKLVNEFLSNAAMAGRGAKIIPNMRNGKSDGFRIYAIRPYSIFGKLGIRNGDVIRSINNQDITSPDKALELYTKLRGASHLTVSVTRRNKPVTLHYTIR